MVLGCGIWSFRPTERTCALTLIGLSFTMMLSCEFNYLEMHIQAVYSAAMLRSRASVLEGQSGTVKGTVYDAHGSLQRERKSSFSNVHNFVLPQAHPVFSSFATETHSCLRDGVTS